jgi:hypothetical protein
MCVPNDFMPGLTEQHGKGEEEVIIFSWQSIIDVV